MSATADPDVLIRSRGRSAHFDAYAVVARFDRSTGTAAFAFGDGHVRLLPRGEEEWRDVAAHDGAVLAMASAVRSGFLTGGDDGKLRRLAADGSIEDVASFGSKWVEHVESFADPKTGVLAAAVGKSVHLFDAVGNKLKTLDHPSTVSGVAFDAKGKRIATSHYGGATLWFVAAKVDSPRKLDWKGSHLSVALHPDGDAVVTTMQENALHGWRLSDGQHMRMSGYPGKSESVSFSRNGRWLATSGADSIVLWPFFGGGPMGKPPTELAGGDNVICSRVAFHPQHEAVAAGFADGLVVLAEVATSKILPVAAPGRGKITAMAWSADGAELAFGTETGFVAVVDFSQR